MLTSHIDVSRPLVFLGLHLSRKGLTSHRPAISFVSKLEHTSQKKKRRGSLDRIHNPAQSRLHFEPPQRPLGRLTRHVPPDRYCPVEIGIDKRGRVAVDVFEAFPDDASFVQKGVVCDERVEGGVLCVLRGVGVGVGIGVRVGTRIGVRGDWAWDTAGGLVHDREMRVAEERDERARPERRRELKQTMVRQL